MNKLLSIPASLMLALSFNVSANESSVNLVSSNQEDIEFPNPDKSYLKDIPRYNAKDLVHINTTINDDTVRQLIGNPHFSEFNSAEWNYLLKIRVPQTRDYIQCQLQIHFDKDDVIENYYWNNQQCADAIEQSIQPIVQQPRIFTLSSDFLFDFDSAELKSSSAVSIDRITSNIQEQYSKIHNIEVVGHTDYLGNAAYNFNLAQERANTVKNELIQRGFNGSLIATSSRGEAEPLTKNCQNMSSSSLKSCLAPDRRVELKVVGDLK